MDTAGSIVIAPADAGGESFTVATAGTFPAWRPRTVPARIVIGRADAGS
jgi:hypothetical protein